MYLPVAGEVVGVGQVVDDRAVAVIARRDVREHAVCGVEGGFGDDAVGAGKCVLRAHSSFSHLQAPSMPQAMR
jgi:hypothetical protein